MFAHFVFLLIENVFLTVLDHALSCQGGGDRIHLHNTLRDTIAHEAKLAFGSHNVATEVGGEFSMGNHRPGDIRISNWKPSQDCLLDVTTVLPTQPKYLSAGASRAGAAAEGAFAAKEQKWALFRDLSPEEFIPLAVELWGGWNPQSASVIQRIATLAAHNTASEVAPAVARFRQRSLVIIYKGVVHSCEARIAPTLIDDDFSGGSLCLRPRNDGTRPQRCPLSERQ